MVGSFCTCCSSFSGCNVAFLFPPTFNLRAWNSYVLVIAWCRLKHLSACKLKWAFILDLWVDKKILEEKDNPASIQTVFLIWRMWHFDNVHRVLNTIEHLKRCPFLRCQKVPEISDPELIRFWSFGCSLDVDIRCMMYHLVQLLLPHINVSHI